MKSVKVILGIAISVSMLTGCGDSAQEKLAKKQLKDRQEAKQEAREMESTLDALGNTADLFMRRLNRTSENQMSKEEVAKEYKKIETERQASIQKPKVKETRAVKKAKGNLEKAKKYFEKQQVKMQALSDAGKEGEAFALYLKEIQKVEKAREDLRLAIKASR